MTAEQMFLSCMMCRGAGGWTDDQGWCPCPCQETHDVPIVGQPKKPADSHCERCGGSGGRRIRGAWRRCECTRPRAGEVAAHKQLNLLGADPK